MDLADAMRGRRSVGRVIGPAPSDGELADLVVDAATGPDHGLLRPWRLVTIRDAARDMLGAAFAAGYPATDLAARQRAAGKPLRAPLLVSIVFTPRTSVRIPEWEQLAATSALVSNLGLLLHARGYAAIWRTGQPTDSPHVRRLLGVTVGERLMGWLYVGTPDPSVSPPPRSQVTPHERIFTLTPSGSVTPLQSVSASAAVTDSP